MLGVGVHLGPAEAGKLTVDVMQQKAFGVEPISGHVAAYGFGSQAGLFGVPMKRSVVYRHKVVDVSLGEGSGGDVGRGHGKRRSHL